LNKIETREQVIDFAKEMLALAKVNREIDPMQESIMPVAFPIVDGQPIVIGLAWEDNNSKHKMIDRLHNSISLVKATALILISDTWTTNIPVGLSLDEGIHQRDIGIIKRKEALIMVVAGKDMPPFGTIAMYSRKDGKIIWDEQQDLPDGMYESWMIPEPWRQPMSKGIA
jgi:hypothetical protein